MLVDVGHRLVIAVRKSTSFDKKTWTLSREEEKT